MISALAAVAAGAGLCAWGYDVFQQGGPCTVHLGFAGIGLIGAGGTLGLFGVVRLVAAIASLGR